jgi:hypothetical protein
MSPCDNWLWYATSYFELKASYFPSNVILFLLLQSWAPNTCLISLM